MKQKTIEISNNLSLNQEIEDVEGYWLVTKKTKITRVIDQILGELDYKEGEKIYYEDLDWVIEENVFYQYQLTLKKAKIDQSTQKEIDKIKNFNAGDFGTADAYETAYFLVLSIDNELETWSLPQGVITKAKYLDRFDHKQRIKNAIGEVTGCWPPGIGDLLEARLKAGEKLEELEFEDTDLDCVGICDYWEDIVLGLDPEKELSQEELLNLATDRQWYPIDPPKKK